MRAYSVRKENLTLGNASVSKVRINGQVSIKVLEKKQQDSNKVSYKPRQDRVKKEGIIKREDTGNMEGHPLDLTTLRCWHESFWKRREEV